MAFFQNCKTFSFCAGCMYDNFTVVDQTDAVKVCVKLSAAYPAETKSGFGGRSGSAHLLFPSAATAARRAGARGYSGTGIRRPAS